MSTVGVKRARSPQHTHKILGPPGTGKTRRLLDLLSTEIRTGTPPERIAFLTFTRAARQEALRRVGRPEADLPYVRTIHSVCYRELGLSQSQVLKAKDIAYFGKILGVSLTGSQISPWMEEDVVTYAEPTEADRLLQLNHLGRHRLTQLRESLVDLPGMDFKFAKWFTVAYRNWKSTESVYDYTDLLTEYIARGRALPVDVVFIDEAQDLSKLQWQVVEKLAGNAQRIYAAGDDDQTIYAWAGADAQTFIDWGKDKVEVLGESRRLTENVFKVAKDISDRILHRAHKAFKPRDCSGLVIHDGIVREEYFHRDKPALVLFRNHLFAKRLEQQLIQCQVPYLGGQSPLGSPEVQACLRGWVKVTLGKGVNFKEASALAHYADTQRPVEFEGEVLREKEHPRNFAKVLHRLPKVDYLQALLERWPVERIFQPNVRICSIHQAKGAEAHTVLLDTGITRATWHTLQERPDEEHRVWYVGTTRASERLVVLSGNNPQEYQI